MNLLLLDMFCPGFALRNLGKTRSTFVGIADQMADIADQMADIADWMVDTAGPKDTARQVDIVDLEHTVPVDNLALEASYRVVAATC